MKPSPQERFPEDWRYCSAAHFLVHGGKFDAVAPLEGPAVPFPAYSADYCGRVEAEEEGNEGDGGAMAEAEAEGVAAEVGPGAAAA